MALLCCSIMLSNSAVKAQSSCPGQIVGCDPWTQVTITTSTDGSPLNGPDSGLCTGAHPTVCCVQITFCYVCCHGVISTFLNSVAPNSNCTMSPQALIDFAAWYCGVYGRLWNKCTSGRWGRFATSKQSTCALLPTVHVEISNAECWEELPSAVVYQGCSEDCGCKTTFDPSRNGTNIDYSNYHTVTTGTGCICAPEPMGAWTPGTCYLITCPNGMGGH